MEQESYGVRVLAPSRSLVSVKGQNYSGHSTPCYIYFLTHSNKRRTVLRNQPFNGNVLP